MRFNSIVCKFALLGIARHVTAKYICRPKNALVIVLNTVVNYIKNVLRITLNEDIFSSFKQHCILVIVVK